MGENECLPDAETLHHIGRNDIGENTGKTDYFLENYSANGL